MFNLVAIKKLTNEGFKKVTYTKWKKNLDRVGKKIKNWF